MAQDGSKPHFAQSPTVAALKYDAGVGPEPHKVMMERSFSQDIQEGTQELKDAAEQTRNIILDLSLDGIIRWVSPSWTDVVGIDLESAKGKPISTYIQGDSTVFDRAIKDLQSNDSKSQYVKFAMQTTPFSDLGPMLDAQGSGEEDDDQVSGRDKVTLELEGQGIMVWDRATGGESHTMWMLQPAVEPIQIEFELPRVLVEMLGIGAEVLAKYLSELAESGANDPQNHPPPLPIACRICERTIVPWWFERHSDLCVQEHKAELDVQMVHESLTEHRHAIVKVLDAFDVRKSRSSSGDAIAVALSPEYKGLSIGSSQNASAVSSLSGSRTASPARSRSPSTNGLSHARGRSSFIVRRPLVRIVELVLDLCDTAIEISVPAIKETKSDQADDFRTQSPVSESRIHQIVSWQQPSSLENEPGLALLSADTERLARAKVETVHRHRVILEYGERIRQEYLAEVDACIAEALIKAQRAAEGEPLSSSDNESESEHEEIIEVVDDKDQRISPAHSPFPIETIEEPEVSRSQSRPPLRSMASALRKSLDAPLFMDSRRPSSQAVSTGSNSPQECPTPKSTRSSAVAQPQPVHSRRSIYASPDEGDASDTSLPSTSVGNSNRRTDSPAPSEIQLGRSASSRTRKRRSMHLHGLSSASPHRGHSPSQFPLAPASPLRMNKARLPSVDTTASPIVSPLLTSIDYPQSPQFHHRRQSSIHSSDTKAPLSPRLSTSAHPQPRAQPPSIKDFEIVKPISKGAFGSVYLSKKKLTGEYFAIKVLRKSDMVAKNQVTNVKAERAIMMWQGESDFVAKLYWTFSSKEYLYLVMEYLNGGDCASLVKILGGLTEDWAKKYIAEVVLGVEHLHARGIVHRDLKPDNLLIDSKGHLKLTDFGLSRMGLVGRQKRALKSPEEPDPDLFKPSNMVSQISGPTSRSASFDYHSGISPGQTPLMTPALAGALDQPSYFTLNRETSLTRDFSRRASGYRSDSGSVSSHDLHYSFSGLGLSDSHEGGSRPISIYQRHNPIEEEAYSHTSASPDLMPLSQSMSNISQPATSVGSQMLPPPTALFDPEESGKRFVGTPDYLAPETIRGTTQDEMCDWWSLGCIVFEFLFGFPPFNASTTEEVFDNILHRRIAWPDDDEVDVSEQARDLINKLIQLDPKQRLGANGQDRFDSGGAEIQAHPWFEDIQWDTLLEDEAQFVPNPENAEDTEYFDSRGATLQAFPEESEDQFSPGLGSSTGQEYADRPHDALFRTKSQVMSAKRGLMPLHIPPHIARDQRNRRLSEPVLADDFGSFTFKNLPVLDKANKDIVEKMRQEAMQAQARSLQSTGSQPPSQPTSTLPTPTITSPSPAIEYGPSIPMTVQRALSVNKQHRPASPSGFTSANASPNRGSLPSSPMLTHVGVSHHERRKTSGSSINSNPQQFAVYDPTIARGQASTSSPVKRLSSISPAKTGGLSTIQPGTPGRNRSHTVGSQDSETPLRDQFVPGHHKRRSQLFVKDQSPSSSDNESGAHTKALLKVQRKRQSSRRMSQFNILEGPSYRPLDILICEDHPVSKIVMEKLFEKLRCRTITAISGPQAIGYAGSNIQFDIIFTEFKLPLINGVDLARMIRDTKSANTQTPIVCITGYLKDLPDEHQFDTLMQKPPTQSKLAEALCKYCYWKPPPDDYKFKAPLNAISTAPISRPYDSPSSVASSRAPTMPESSYKGSSRQDSISSGGFFSDLESLKADEIPLITSRTGTEDWKTGLGISEETNVSQHTQALSTFPRLTQTESAPPMLATEEQHLSTIDTARTESSPEIIRTKRESIEKIRSAIGGAEEGDDEDEELGRLNVRQRSPTIKSTRTGSKLGYEMLRTNSRGSVISMHDDRNNETDSLRKSLEILESRMEGLRIPEEDAPILGSVQPRKGRTLVQSNADVSTDHGSHGHITPPILFPQAPGNDSKNIEMDDEQQTPMADKVIDFGDQPTPRAHSENGSTSQRDDL